jgi:hypothetical protein
MCRYLTKRGEAVERFDYLIMDKPSVIVSAAAG